MINARGKISPRGVGDGALRQRQLLIAEGVEFSDADEFLSRFRMTNEQQNEIVLSAAQNGLTVRQAAQQWVDDNESVWRVWIPR